MSACLSLWALFSCVGAFVALFGWLACYMIAIGEEPGSADHQFFVRIARRFLAFTVLAWLWPIALLVASIRAVFQVLKEQS